MIIILIKNAYMCSDTADQKQKKYRCFSLPYTNWHGKTNYFVSMKTSPIKALINSMSGTYRKINSFFMNIANIYEYSIW